MMDTISSAFSTTPDDPYSFNSSEVHVVFESEDSILWIGSVKEGINYYDHQTGHFHKLPIPGTESLRIWDYYEAADGRLWIATKGNGLAVLNRQDSSVQYFIPQFAQIDDWYSTIRFIHPQKTNPSFLWLGTRNGLISFNIADSTFARYPMPFQAFDDKEFMIMDCVEDSQGVLWFGSYWGGLMSYDYKSDKWKQFLFNSQFPSELPRYYDVLNELIFIKPDLLLLATSSGPLLYHTISRSFDHISIESSNFDAQFNMAMSVHQISDGTVIVAGVGPVLSVSLPPSDDTSVILNSPYLTDIKIDGKPLPGNHAVETIHEITLSEDQRDLGIEIATPQLKGPRRIKFSHRLSGHDKEWVNNDNRRYVSYTNLSGGRYTFQYRVSSDGLNWVQGNSDLSIIKKIPFWRHPAFIVAVLTFFIGIISLVAHLRVRAIRREAKLKTDFAKRLMEVELSALRAQMNPHFMFNSLNSIKYYILKNNNEAANKYLTKFSQLMRSVLKDSKSRLISLDEELHALQLYIELEALRFTEKGFDFHIQVSDVNPETLYLPPLLVQPYVENAIWHGLLHKESPGTLWVRVNKNGKALFIEIEDDGIGREAARFKRSKSATKNKSYGMQITSDRIDLVKATFGIDSSVNVQDLYDERGAPAGTKVTLGVPLITEEDYERILESSNH